MIQFLLIPFILLVPGSIPIYCLVTFGLGMFDCASHRVLKTDECTRRYQVYSMYKLGVRFATWMSEHVK